MIVPYDFHIYFHSDYTTECPPAVGKCPLSLYPYQHLMIGLAVHNHLTPFTFTRSMCVCMRGHSWIWDHSWNKKYYYEVENKRDRRKWRGRKSNKWRRKRKKNYLGLGIFWSFERVIWVINIRMIEGGAWETNPGFKCSKPFYCYNSQILPFTSMFFKALSNHITD